MSDDLDHWKVIFVTFDVNTFDLGTYPWPQSEQIRNRTSTIVFGSELRWLEWWINKIFNIFRNPFFFSRVSKCSSVFKLDSFIICHKPACSNRTSSLNLRVWNLPAEFSWIVDRLGERLCTFSILLNPGNLILFHHLLALIYLFKRTMHRFAFLI